MLQGRPNQSVETHVEDQRQQPVQESVPFVSDPGISFLNHRGEQFAHHSHKYIHNVHNI